MADRFEVHVNGQKVGGWTSAKLTRARKDLTGELELEVFYGSIPSTPVLQSVKAGAKIEVFIAGTVAFTGKIDKRKARGKKKKTTEKGDDPDSSTFQRSVTIGKDAYTITVTARGTTKRLIDSSHDHPTGTLKNVSPADVVRALTKNFGLTFQDNSQDTTQIEKARFRDGAMIVSEIHRFTKEHNLIVNEARDGTLQMTKPGNEPRGVDLTLSTNILEFSAEQSEDAQNSKVTVKGQRTNSSQWGSDAIMRSVSASLNGTQDYSPFTVQLSGDATDDRLKKRVQVENRERQEASKNITVDVFDVQSSQGTPWDIGVRHYVEVPAEGIFDDFIADELLYTVDAEGTLKTTLTLVVATDASGGASRSDSRAKGDAKRAQLEIGNQPGQYPDLWSVIEMVFQ
jgi:prophage tail gpP-like protein